MRIEQLKIVAWPQSESAKYYFSRAAEIYLTNVVIPSR
jgi:hypothetical protein